MTGNLRPGSHFDLHLHSQRSDGRHAPDEVVRLAARAGLDVIALTDHDLASELTLGPQQVEGRTLTVLGGAEVSGCHAGREYHLLVYFPHAIPEGFRAFCEDQAKGRALRYERARSSLGLDLPPAGPEAHQGELALTRLHLARAIVEGGHATSVKDAFRKYLSGAHGHVPKIELPFVDAIRVARAFGGFTSWAHPPVAAVKEHLSTFVEAGLQGLEALRPMVTAKDRNTYRRLAKRHGLVLTGGSDWHGWPADGPLGLFRIQAREISGFVDLLLAA